MLSAGNDPELFKQVPGIGISVGWLGCCWDGYLSQPAQFSCHLASLINTSKLKCQIFMHILMNTQCSTRFYCIHLQDELNCIVCSTCEIPKSCPLHFIIGLFKKMCLNTQQLHEEKKIHMSKNSMKD